MAACRCPPAEHEPSTYRGAGELLALLHDRPAVVDEEYGARLRDTVLTRLGRPHRIAPGLLARLRAEVAGWPTPAARLVPAHGDWHEPGPWRREWIAEAVGTATWALKVGDEPFEAHGHRMLTEAFPD